MFRKQKTTKREYELHVQQSHIMDRNYKILRNTSHTHNYLVEIDNCIYFVRVLRNLLKKYIGETRLHNVAGME